MAQRVNLSAYRGEGWIGEFGPPFDATTGLREASPENITGWTIRFVIHPTEKDSTIKLQKTTVGGAGVTITNGAAGLFEVALTKADTESLDIANYWCHVWRSSTGGETMLATGPFRILGPSTA